MRLGMLLRDDDPIRHNALAEHPSFMFAADDKL